MMRTRCPACQTAFRIRPEQLHAQRGKVRCGHCLVPFNALEHLLDDAEPAETTAKRTPPSTEHPPHVPTALAPASPLPPAPKAQDAVAGYPPMADSGSPGDLAPDFEIPEVWRSPREHLKAADPETASAEPPPAATADIPKAPDTLLPALDLSHAGESHDGAHAVPGTHQPFSSAFMQLGDGRAEPAAATDAASAWDGPRDNTRLPQSPAHAAGETDGEDEEDAQLQSELDERYGPHPQARPPRRWLAGLAVGILLGMLAVQAAYLFRQEITRALPSLRPLYQTVCLSFGCTLPLSRDSERIGIALSELQSDPQVPGRYVLHANVRNNASWPQAWPHLELTLTDATDRPVARRVLDPQEWAHAETAKLRAGFPAGRDQAVELHFDAPEVAPTGYRLYIFYP